jgi:hypothetical protein
LRPKEGVQPPRKTLAPAPQSTAAMKAEAREEEVVIAVVIGSDGVLRSPRILVHQYPGYAFVVGETVRRWRFQPARLHGEAVAARYNILVTWTGRR